jgi:ssRNA-specific RNase YbeY (16S rRNA maturation enzyme)
MLDKNHQAEVLFLATDYGTRLESAMGFLRNEAVGQLNLAYKDKDVKLTEILSFTAQEKNYNNLLGHEKVKE